MLLSARILSFLILLAATAGAQPYTLLIENGYVIDPATNRHDTLDIAIKDNKIAKIAQHIDPQKAKEEIDAKGMIVCPGLIDIHTHVFYGNGGDREYAGGPEGMHPDSFTFKTGITTIVDAGSSGWRSFPEFKERVIDHSQTRVLAFLNIVGAGMRGSPYEQDTSDMNSEPAAVTAKKYSKLIVGIKVAHYRGGLWHPVDAAVKAGTIAHIPVMIDFGGHLPPLSIQELFENHLRANDIFTHCFAQLRDRESVVDTITKQIKPFIKQAQQKPIIFDVGYGEISFTFKQAIPAITQGFLPNSISTDIHVGATHDILDIMSQFLAMGVDLPQVISMTTANPAKEIKHQELGGLQKGAVADIAILAIKKGQFQFTDHTGQSIQGSQKLECIWTIRAGRIVYQHAGRIVYQHFCPIFTSHS